MEREVSSGLKISYNVFNMNSFTCEDANKLPYSNDFLDEGIAMRLLLNTYENRIEAEPFWKKKKELEALWQSKSKNLTKLNSILESALDVGAIGASRKETDRILSTLQIMELVTGILVSGFLYIKVSRTILLNVQNPNMKEAMLDRGEFIRRYQQIYLKKKLGGTWKPRYSIFLFSLNWLSGF